MTQSLILGPNGFIAKNLRCALTDQPNVNAQTLGRDASLAELDAALAEAEIIYHLAGVNRPENPDEFWAGNAEFTRTLCDRMRAAPGKRRVVFTSSIQAGLDNPYGRSKLEAERVLTDWARGEQCDVAIYRLPNVFGKWCRPNYNSVVATFCHNLAAGLPIQTSASERQLTLVHVGDVVDALVSELPKSNDGVSRGTVANAHRITVGELAKLLRQFQCSRSSLLMPSLRSKFEKDLYGTYLSYLPREHFDYPLQQRIDERGVLAEFIKSESCGQIFVSRTKPGVTRGNHFHHTKAEKFLVLEGDAVVRFRAFDDDEVLEYRVAGRDLRVVDIPTGFTHSIENVGSGEMVVLFWASEIFDPARPDTYFCPVVDAERKSDESSDHCRDAA